MCVYKLQTHVISLPFATSLEKYQIGDHTHLAYKEDSKVGMKLLIDGWSCFYPPDLDPSNMCSNSTGKLVEYLIADNEHVTEGQPYCNIEAMKMIMPLLASRVLIRQIFQSAC